MSGGRETSWEAIQSLRKIKSKLELWQQEMKRKGIYEILLRKKRPTLITLCGWKVNQVFRFQTLEKETLVVPLTDAEAWKNCRFKATDGFSLIYMTLKCQQDTQKEIFSR